MLCASALCKPLCDGIKTGASPVSCRGQASCKRRSAPRHTGFSCFPMEFGPAVDGPEYLLQKRCTASLFRTAFSRSVIENTVLLLPWLVMILSRGFLCDFAARNGGDLCHRGNKSLPRVFQFHHLAFQRPQNRIKAFDLSCKCLYESICRIFCAKSGEKSQNPAKEIVSAHMV